MAKKLTLLEHVAAGLPHKGPKPLIERLPADLYEEMLVVRDAWRDGKLDTKRATKTAVGGLLAKHLSDLGHPIGQEAVTRWLAGE